MRILAVTPYYEPEGGGLERYAHAILARLASRGHEVEVHAFTCEGLGDAEAEGLRLHRHRFVWRLGNSPIDLRFHGTLRAAVKRFSPDVVVGHTPVPFPADIAAAVARGSDVPFVPTYHAGRLSGSSGFLNMLATIYRVTLEGRMLARSSHLIASSAFVRDNALSRHRERVTVVPPGVDARRFVPRASPTQNEVLFLGPISNSYRWKGLDTLWRAFKLIRAEIPEARLTLAGTGDRLPEFAQLARALGGVRMPGRIPEADLVSEYQRATVVALPSTSDAEAFGMVLAEANACGRPVVGSRIGGIPDFVEDDRNGLLANPGDPADLAQKILVLLRDAGRARRLGDYGRSKVIRNHDWDALAKATETVLHAAT